VHFLHIATGGSAGLYTVHNFSRRFDQRGLGYFLIAVCIFHELRYSNGCLKWEQRGSFRCCSALVLLFREILKDYGIYWFWNLGSRDGGSLNVIRQQLSLRLLGFCPYLGWLAVEHLHGAAQQRAVPEDQQGGSQPDQQEQHQHQAGDRPVFLLLWGVIIIAHSRFNPSIRPCDMFSCRKGVKLSPSS